MYQIRLFVNGLFGWEESSLERSNGHRLAGEATGVSMGPEMCFVGMVEDILRNPQVEI